MLLVLVHRADTPAAVRVRLHAALGRGRARSTADALTGGTIPLSGGEASVEMPGRSFRLLRFTGRKGEE